LTRLNDVAGSQGIAGNRIFNGRDQQMKADRQAVSGDEGGQRQRVSCAAHVLLHQPHSARRLDVEPAAVEADTFADDRDSRILRVAPFELNQSRRMFL
jgi:hypothetical protein